MKRLFLLILSVILALGCTTMPTPRYSISIDNNQTLKQFDHNRIVLISLDEPMSADIKCRAGSPIKVTDGLTITQFIKKAFNDEFRFANIYGADNGIKLRGTMDKMALSSTADHYSKGWWDLGITLYSPDGKTLSIENRYNFESSFSGWEACSKVAQALVPAVQDLINKTVSHPSFRSLIN